MLNVELLEGRDTPSTVGPQPEDPIATPVPAPAYDKAPVAISYIESTIIYVGGIILDGVR